uniref:Uncharacterized protein n=1 Tax=Romanomermis culicivorax TaxID=13658 RepID=A0A915JE63_ROMCU
MTSRTVQFTCGYNRRDPHHRKPRDGRENKLLFTNKMRKFSGAQSPSTVFPQILVFEEQSSAEREKILGDRREKDINDLHLFIIKFVDIEEN